MAADPRYSQPQIYPDRLFDPPVLCPVCRQPVTGLAAANIHSDSGTVNGAAASRRAAGSMTSRITWSLYPCYHSVEQHWASHFATEMSRRENGHPPREVVGMPQATRAKRLRELTSLYNNKTESARLAGRMNQISRRFALEMEILRIVQDIESVTVGARATLEPYTLHPGPLTEAAKLHYLLPPGNASGDNQRVVASMTRITVSAVRRAISDDPSFDDVPNERIQRVAEHVHQRMSAYAAGDTSVTFTVSESNLVARLLGRDVTTSPVITPTAAGPTPENDKTDSDVYDPVKAFINRASPSSNRKIIRLKPDKEDV